MDGYKFEDEMRALDVCAKCLDETKPRLSLLRCTGCRMVLYCSKDHQTGHWKEHRAFCKARKNVSAGLTSTAENRRGSVPPLPSPRVAAGKEECETFVSVCDATGVFSILGMFWKGGKTGKLCNLMVKLGKGPVSCVQTKLQDWEPRTRLAALKTLTVQGSADYVRVTPDISAWLTQRALDESTKDEKGRGGTGGVPGDFRAAAADFLAEASGEATRVSALCGLDRYLASEAHETFKTALLECYDGGASLDVFFFGLLNERREFRDCYSFLEGMAQLGGAETFEEALRKLSEVGEAENGRATARLCEHASWCFHLAGLPGVASAMQIAKEGCDKNFSSSPFAKAMMYRTAYRNAAGDVGPPGRPELAEQYKELVLKPLHEAQEASGQPLAQLTPVSVEIKALLEEGILL